MSVQQTPSSVENLAVGKGIISVGQWSGTTPPGSYSDMGNCPSLTVEPATERLPHYSSRTEFRLKDKNPIIQNDYTLTFDLDEMAAVNLNKFLMGTMSGSQILGLQGANLEFAIKFVSDNPIGPNQQWDFWKCTLSPSGALQLIGDEWMFMSFTAEGLADTTNHATSPYFTVSYSSSSSSLSSSSSSSSA